MRHFLLTCDGPADLPAHAFKKSLGRNRPQTLEGKGGGAPAAPDPWQTAAAATTQNQNTAVFNKALNLGNYSNPFGSQYSTVVATDPWSGAPIYNTQIQANPQLTGAMNGLFGQIGNSGSINQGALSGLSGLNSTLSGYGNQAQGIAGQLGGYQQGVMGLMPAYGGLNSGLSYLNGQVGALGSTLDNNAAAQAQQQGQDAAYKAQTQYLDPQFSQQQESLSAQLANQGLTPGSQAYNNAMLNFNNQKQQAYGNAANQAVMTGSQIGTQNWNNQLAGLSAQSGLFGQQASLMGQQGSNLGQQAGLFGLGGNLAQGQLGALGTGMSAAGQQAGIYGQQVGIGQAPYSNLQTIASMIPGYSGPASSGAQPADIAGYMNNAYQGQLAGYNANTASSNATTGALGTLGAAGLMSIPASGWAAAGAALMAF